MKWIVDGDMDLCLDDTKTPPLVMGAVRATPDGFEAMRISYAFPKGKLAGEWATRAEARDAVERS